LERLRKIKLLILDVDGVMTDGRIILGDDGSEYRAFNVKDGLGIKLAQEVGIRVAIITGKESRIVARRAEQLGIEDCYCGYPDKFQAYKQILAKYNIRDKEIAFVGDDINDLPIMERVGFRAAVGDAHPEVKKVADYVTQACGGDGAVREVVDLLLGRRQNEY